MARWIAVALVVLVACGDDGAPVMDGGAEDGAIGIDGGPDGAAAAAVCGVGSLSGGAPIARVVSGMADLVPIGSSARTMTQEVAASIWFPSGRVSGADAFFSFESFWPLEGQHVAVSRVADDGSVRFGIGAYHGARELSGTLLLAGGSDDLELTITSWNLAPEWSDRADAWVGTATLCAGPVNVADPTLRAAWESIGISPNAEIHLTPSVPIDPATLRVVVRAAGVEVPIDARLERNALVITAVDAFPPSAALTVDTTGTLDVLGRPVVLVDPPVALITTATIEDYTFATAPPPGATAGAVEGLLVGGGSTDAASALIALGDPGGSALRITATLHCRGLGPEVALVAASGASTQVEHGGCTSDVTPVEVLVARPALGPLWLSAWTPAVRRPQWLTVGSSQMAIRAIAVE